MGKVRQAMRSVAMIHPDVAAILDAADRAIRMEAVETYASALVGIFDRARRQLTFASAGHPGPVLRYPDGQVEHLAVPGIWLGLRAREAGELRAVSIPLGSTLVFHTDGLIEATRDLDDGYRRLHDALSDARFLSAENRARFLVDHVLGKQAASDDVAVLVAAITA